jgi:hypothetical protein
MPKSPFARYKVLEAYLSGAIAQDRAEYEFSWSCVSEVARSRFYYKCKEYSEPTSGLENR